MVWIAPPSFVRGDRSLRRRLARVNGFSRQLLAREPAPPVVPVVDGQQQAGGSETPAPPQQRSEDETDCAVVDALACDPTAWAGWVGRVLDGRGHGRDSA